MGIAPPATLLVILILVENGSFGQRQTSQVDGVTSKENFPSFRAFPLTKTPTKTTTRATFKPLTTKPRATSKPVTSKNQPLKQQTTTKKGTTNLVMTTTVKNLPLRQTTTTKKKDGWTRDPKLFFMNFNSNGNFLSHDSIQPYNYNPNSNDSVNSTTEILDPEEEQQTSNGTDATPEFYEELEFTTPMEFNGSSTIEANPTTTTRKKLKRRKTTTQGLSTRKKLKRRRTTTEATNEEA